MDLVPIFYGLAAAVFNGKLKSKFAPLDTTPMSSASAAKSVWKMTRAELLNGLEDLGVAIRQEWTVPELRATLIEEQEVRGIRRNRLVGLTKLDLDGLKVKWRRSAEVY